MDAEATIRDYYGALRSGDPLGQYFARDDGVVKFGISERLTGYDAIAEGLQEQARTTDAWEVRSRRLRVTERDCHAWFSDDVFMAWTDTERGIRFEFDTRWSGTLERGDDQWLFVGLHVSTAGEV